LRPKLSKLRLAGAAVLLAAALGIAAPARDPFQAVHLQTVIWPADGQGFGGFSGLVVAPDGERFTTVTDDGWRVDGVFRREDGLIVAIADARAVRLRALDGTPIDPDIADAEGLARGSDGTLFVSFERRHRLFRYREGMAPQDVALPEALRALRRNRGPEALAIDGEGRLLVIGEQSRVWFGDFTVWRQAATGWDDLSLPRRGPFLPVGADVGPDGRLYVLERAFLGIGFRSRVRRFDIGATALENETLLLRSGLRRHDNLEGLSVWRDGAGAIRLTMISDDNRNRLQQTQLVEYRLPDDLARTGDTR
jgi:hypothetical protein